jgi:hypothetical protein
MITGEDNARVIKKLTNERNPLNELHRTLIQAFPATPGDISITGETTAYPGKDGKAEVHDNVTVTINTTVTGAYYIADTLYELLRKARETHSK